MSAYSEHDKLDGEAPEAVTRFIEWLQDQGYVICEVKHRALMPGPSPSELIIKHFGVDKEKLEAERKQMLEELRKLDEGITE